MATAIDETRHGIGGNAPPAIEAHRLHIEELLTNAQQFLDGEPVSSQEQADDVGRLLSMLREARKGADQQRAAEKKPHDDAGKAVQAAWKPIIDQCDRAADVAKRALEPFLIAEEDRKRREAAEARQLAEAQRHMAEEQRRSVNLADLSAVEQAEIGLRDAQDADRTASRLERDKAQAKTEGRAVGLRSVWSAVIVDRRAALTAYLRSNADEFEDTIQKLADHEARNGPRTTPGIQFTENRVAV